MFSEDELLELAMIEAASFDGSEVVSLRKVNFPDQLTVDISSMRYIGVPEDEEIDIDRLVDTLEDVFCRFNLRMTSISVKVDKADLDEEKS